jgi:hypothetical protein
MKTYSTSKFLVVVFVIVLLLSLPYAFADKPTDKPGHDKEPTYTWSVYIPVDTSSGLQGVFTPVEAPSEVPVSVPVYAFEATNPSTRNFVNDSSFFNFEVMYNDDDTLPMEFKGIENACPEDDESTVGACVEMFTQIGKPQPNGDPFGEYAVGKSERIWIAFVSYSGFNHSDQPFDDPGTDENEEEIWPLARGVFYIDSELVGNGAYQNEIGGKFGFENDCDLTLTRKSENVWHIEGTFIGISATQYQVTYEQECNTNGKRCWDVRIFTTPAKGTANYLKSIDLYFVRTPQ